MSDFLLIHGSGQNAGCWSRVAAQLRARGHVVVAPDLPKQAPTWGLHEHAAEVARAISSPATIVVGHSLCGALLPLVPAIRPCARLVFLAAVVPEPGKSVREQFMADPSMFCPEWIAAGPHWSDPTQQARLACEFLFHDCSAESMPWSISTVQAIDSQRIITQPAPFDHWPNVPTTAIVAAADRTLSPEWCRRVARRLSGVEPMELQTGHCPQNSRPVELAALLERIAKTGT